MAAESGDEMTIQAAADLLGLQFRTVYNLIDRGQLGEVSRPSDRPKRRRTYRLRRSDVDAYIERARVKPGDLRHLYADSLLDGYR